MNIQNVLYLQVMIVSWFLQLGCLSESSMTKVSCCFFIFFFFFSFSSSSFSSFSSFILFLFLFFSFSSFSFFFLLFFNFFCFCSYFFFYFFFSFFFLFRSFFYLLFLKTFCWMTQDECYYTLQSYESKIYELRPKLKSLLLHIKKQYVQSFLHPVELHVTLLLLSLLVNSTRKKKTERFCYANL